MNSLRAYQMELQQLAQRKSFKEVCDACVPDEYIELDEFVIQVLELLTDHCIETIEDLKEVLEHGTQVRFKK